MTARKTAEEILDEWADHETSMNEDDDELTLHVSLTKLGRRFMLAAMRRYAAQETAAAEAEVARLRGAMVEIRDSFGRRQATHTAGDAYANGAAVARLEIVEWINAALGREEGA